MKIQSKGTIQLVSKNTSKSKDGKTTYNRLYAIKDKAGESEMDGNDFACYLLVRELRRLHPEKALAPYTEEEEDFDDCFWCD
jgi:hypothetical protein